MSFPETFLMLGDPPSMKIGSAEYGQPRPVPQPQPGNPFPAPPWPGPRQCACHLPRSEFEGHNCPANGWRWTPWPS